MSELSKDVREELEELLPVIQDEMTALWNKYDLLEQLHDFYNMEETYKEIERLEREFEAAVEELYGVP